MIVLYPTRIKTLISTFFKTHERILKQPRGGGYWLWKPYFVDKTLQQLSDGDFLFYCDSDTGLTHPVDPIFHLTITKNQDIIPFELPYHIEKEWTKRDLFISMNCDTPNYYDTPQRRAGFFVLRKSALSVKFVREWLSLAQDEHLLTDTPNQLGTPNYPGFQEHRHDQSIFSLLSKKYHLTFTENSLSIQNYAKFIGVITIERVISKITGYGAVKKAIKSALHITAIL